MGLILRRQTDSDISQLLSLAKGKETRTLDSSVLRYVTKSHLVKHLTCHMKLGGGFKFTSQSYAEAANTKPMKLKICSTRKNSVRECTRGDERLQVS